MSVAEQILHSSWKSLMARNVGRSVIVSFLIGTQNTIVTHGILYEVGNDYIALYQPDEQSYISADLYSIRFVEFLPEISQTNSRQQQAAGKEKREKRGALLLLSLLPALRCVWRGRGACREPYLAAAGGEKETLALPRSDGLARRQRTSPSPSRISSERKDSAPHVAACGAASRSTVK